VAELHWTKVQFKRTAVSNIGLDACTDSLLATRAVTATPEGARPNPLGALVRVVRYCAAIFFSTEKA